MNNIELLQCLIETEINKLKYAINMLKIKGQNNKIKRLTQQILGLKTSLNFIEEIENMED